MNVYPDIGPPQEGLHKRRTVIESDLQLDVASCWVEADAMHPLHAVQRIVIGTPNRLRAVSMLFNFRLDRHERGGPVMLRPVELDAAGNPWTGEAYQRRFDYVLAVKEVIAVCFVQPHMDSAANLRQHHHANEFIF